MSLGGPPPAPHIGKVKQIHNT